MKVLDIARQCGAIPNDCVALDGVTLYPTIIFTPTQLTAFADRIRAAEREWCAAKFQAEVDHAAINELRLVPEFGQARGRPGIASSAIEAAIFAIRAGGEGERK